MACLPTCCRRVQTLGSYCRIIEAIEKVNTVIRCQCPDSDPLRVVGVMSPVARRIGSWEISVRSS